MIEHRREGRLSADEAHEDIERLNRAASEAGMPRLEDLECIEDVKALETMLEEAGLYTGPTIPDTIELGAEQLVFLKRRAVEKDPREVHYEAQVMEALQRMFRDRFAMDVPPFPTERILHLTDDAFEDAARRFSSIFASDPKSIAGRFDPDNGVIMVRHGGERGFAARLQITTHELTHWALYAQPRHKTPSIMTFQRLLEEGITELIAMEALAPLLDAPDLIVSARQWLQRRDAPAPDSPSQVIPTVERMERLQKHDEIFFSTVHFGYPMQRYLIEDVVRAVHTDDTTHGDLLKVLVDAVVNRDVGPFKRRLRAAYGSKAIPLLFEQGGDPLDVASALHTLRKKHRGGVNTAPSSAVA